MSVQDEWPRAHIFLIPCVTQAFVVDFLSEIVGAHGGLFFKWVLGPTQGFCGQLSFGHLFFGASRPRPLGVQFALSFPCLGPGCRVSSRFAPTTPMTCRPAVGREGQGSPQARHRDGDRPKLGAHVPGQPDRYQILIDQCPPHDIHETCAAAARSSNVDATGFQGMQQQFNRSFDVRWIQRGVQTIHDDGGCRFLLLAHPMLGVQFMLVLGVGSNAQGEWLALRRAGYSKSVIFGRTLSSDTCGLSPCGAPSCLAPREVHAHFGADTGSVLLLRVGR